jgi:subtilase family serine protease
MNSALEYAAARQVTVVAASGDQGAIGNGSTAPVKEVILPASDPLVLGAGGTSAAAPFWAGLIALADQQGHCP